MKNPFISNTSQPNETNIIVDILQTVVVALSICVIIYLFIATPNEVHGQSMEPNFHDGDLLLTNKIIQIFGATKLKSITGEYQRGDVIIFNHTLSQEDFIKRIIAVSGDTVLITGGYVYVNGVKLNEPYLPEGRLTNGGNFIQEGQPVVVPSDSYVCFGDNRGNSTDSRSNLVGFVKRSQMRGKVFLRYYPFDHFGVIKGQPHPELESNLFELQHYGYSV